MVNAKKASQIQTLGREPPSRREIALYFNVLFDVSVRLSSNSNRMRNFLFISLLIGALWFAFDASVQTDMGYLGRQLHLKADSINARVGDKVGSASK